MTPVIAQTIPDGLRYTTPREPGGQQERCEKQDQGPKDQGPGGHHPGHRTSCLARKVAGDLRRFKEIGDLKLCLVLKPAFIPEWLSIPNEEFEGLKPLEVIERGEMDRLWDMIFYLESGIAS